MAILDIALTSVRLDLVVLSAFVPLVFTIQKDPSRQWLRSFLCSYLVVLIKQQPIHLYRSALIARYISSEPNSSDQLSMITPIQIV